MKRAISLGSYSVFSSSLSSSSSSLELSSIIFLPLLFFVALKAMSCGPLTYSNNECAKQLLYALDNHVWGMKITALEESADFATLDTEKLFSNLKSHELSRKGRLNHDVSLSSKALITSAHVGGHDANPTNTIVSFALKFALSSLVAAFDE
jgi:hypothetical protein